MSVVDVFLFGVGLSMDAFAVAICKGLAMRQVNKKQMLVIALFFGGFQALMPLIGWLVGSTFAKKIVAFDHWIAFILLLYVSQHMEDYTEDFVRNILSRLLLRLGFEDNNKI